MDRYPFGLDGRAGRRVTIGRASREDDAALECTERLNGPHCPHVVSERVHLAELRCCWCGANWSEPRAASFDHHGPYDPKRTREGGL
jgi:hypothetical protein